MAEFAPNLVDITIGDSLNLIPVSSKTAADASLLDWSHLYPFDRIIAAVAVDENADLISGDQGFDELGSIKRIWA